MKSLILSLTVILMMNLSAIAHNEPSESATLKKKVITKVKLHVEYPEFAIEQDIKGIVYVSFTLNDDGSIKVEEIHSTQPLLQEYVTNKLDELNINEELIDPEMTYIVKFKFDLN